MEKAKSDMKDFIKSPSKTIILYQEEEDDGDIISSSVENSPIKPGSEGNENSLIKVWKCPKCSYLNDLD